MEADDATDSQFALGSKYVIVRSICQRRNIRKQRRIIVVEDKNTFVVGILVATRASIPRTQIAVGVVVDRRGALRFCNFSLPGTLGAMRRYQNPLLRQRIKAAVGYLKPGRWRHRSKVETSLLMLIDVALRCSQGAPCCRPH